MQIYINNIDDTIEKLKKLAKYIINQKKLRFN